MSKSRIPGSPGSSRITSSGRAPGAAGSAIKSKVNKPGLSGLQTCLTTKYTASIVQFLATYHVGLNI